MNIFLYQLKYFLSRSYVWAFVVSLLIIYSNGITDIVKIVFTFPLCWFVIQTFREALNGFSIIPNASDIYKGGEDNQGIQEIIDQANLFLYIVTPFVEFGNNLMRNILDAQKNCEEVIILVSRGRGMSKQSIQELNKLKESGCDIRTHPDLHSKIFLNENHGIITSMNLYQPSVKKSLEVGVRIENSEKIREIQDLIEDYIEDIDTKPFQAGFCIKTKELIDYNPLKPIDSDVFKYNDRQYSWKYCHKCGKESAVTVSNPLCDEHK